MLSYLEEETEADPLVVLDVPPLFWVNGFVDARMGHVEANPFPEGTGDRVRRVDPAVGVQHVFRDVLGVDAVDGVADILPGRHNQAEGQQTDDGEGVVEPEDGRVDVNVADFDQGLQAAEYVDHASTFQTLSLYRRCTIIT